MVMPIMDGVATIRALRRISPDIKIIAATGMSDPAQTSNLALANVQLRRAVKIWSESHGVKISGRRWAVKTESR